MRANLCRVEKNRGDHAILHSLSRRDHGAYFSGVDTGPGGTATAHFAVFSHGWRSAGPGPKIGGKGKSIDKTGQYGVEMSYA